MSSVFCIIMLNDCDAALRYVTSQQNMLTTRRRVAGGEEEQADFITSHRSLLTLSL